MLQCDDPALSTLQFNGVSEYFEDLVAQIDAPLLNDISIIFLHQLVFDTPQLRSSSDSSLIQMVSRFTLAQMYALVVTP